MNDMTASEALKLFGSLLMIANMALNVYLFRRTITGAELKAMREAQRKGDEGLALRIDKHDVVRADFDRRLSVLETRVDALPTHDDLTEIREMLAGNIERTNATFDAVKDLRNYLMANPR